MNDLAERTATHQSSVSVVVRRLVDRGLVSRHAVSDVVGGTKQYGCDAAMVITNSYFTEGAIALAEANECALVDRDTLAGWMEEARGGEG